MQIILLSGGAGKRLWPLSNDARSKQFLRLLADGNGGLESMVQRVRRQLASVWPDANVLVVTGEAQREPTLNQLGGQADILVEPSRRNNYPAIALAAAYLADQKHLPESEPVVVIPVDPYVDAAYFQALEAMERAVRADAADIVLMGVTPTEPSDRYGYIQSAKTAVDAGGAQVYPVLSFVEKPSVERAHALLRQGAVWNGGAFAFRLRYLLNLLQQRLGFCSYAQVCAAYDRLTASSFDYQVVEQADSIAMVRYDGPWEDLGTWDALARKMDRATVGDVQMDDHCRDTFAINELNRPLLVLGAKNLVVAASQDGVLVADRESCTRLQELVGSLHRRPMFEERRWGECRVLCEHAAPDGPMLVNHLSLRAGKAIGEQLHQRRTEIWTVTAGQGEWKLDGQTRILGPGDVARIEAGQKHRLYALTDMSVIEVQLGDRLGNEDIERFEE